MGVYVHVYNKVFMFVWYRSTHAFESQGNMHLLVYYY